MIFSSYIQIGTVSMSCLLYLKLSYRIFIQTSGGTSVDTSFLGREPTTNWWHRKSPFGTASNELETLGVGSTREDHNF